MYMKIKEVIAKTDLTDRAIRLYIENGLVSPSITENYSGRKNIEFSDDDLVAL
ncbi:MAG: MerR family transcriptional regulator, partial [Clostridia bacterium]|nr:MerR family transcriptional regulator [Clostridia bacterium]